MSAAKPTDPPSPPPVPYYPGGENNPAYRLTFQAWVILFLGVLCIGLLSYLGSYLKAWFQ